MAILHFGASVRGPLHINQKRPNEDSWLGCSGSYGSLIAVCDGLGSRRQARHGSRTGCMAVREAVRLWSKAEEASTQHLIWLIEILWRIRLSPAPPEDCATTCLFALKQPSGRWIVGGLGDGLGIIKRGGDVATPILRRRIDNFANQTDGLGCPHAMTDWTVETFEPSEDETTVALFTDGIADDLIEERIDDFLAWLIDSFARRLPRERWQMLCQELRDWPTPGHQDDKTLAVLWEPEQPKS
jgi:serine/threonine protein phosphatase PrpC